MQNKKNKKVFQYFSSFVLCTHSHLVPEFVQSGIIKYVSLFGVVILQVIVLEWSSVSFPIHSVLGQDHCTT